MSVQSVSPQLLLIVILASHLSRLYSSAAPGTHPVLPAPYYTTPIVVRLMDPPARCFYCSRRAVPSQQASFNAFLQRQMIANWKRFAKVLMRIQRLRRIMGFVGQHLDYLRIKGGRPTKSELRALKKD